MREAMEALEALFLNIQDGNLPLSSNDLKRIVDKSLDYLEVPEQSTPRNQDLRTAVNAVIYGVERYLIDPSIQGVPAGGYVAERDYDALAAEVVRLRGILLAVSTAVNQ